MSVSISIIGDDIHTALRTFLLSILPAGIEVVQGQDNQVSMPVGDFVVMTDVRKIRLSTNIDSYDDIGSNPGSKLIETHINHMIQLDFYGQQSGDWAAMVQSLFRDSYAVDALPQNIVPLYADDPVQMPLISGESQYVARWKLQVNLQYNPITTVPQYFAAELEIGNAGNPVTANTTSQKIWSGLKNIDVTFPA